MEYIYYLLVVGSILSLLLFLLVRSAGLREERDRNPARIQARKHAQGEREDSQTDTESLAAQFASAVRRTSSVPTPWGWPGHNEHADHSAGPRYGRSFGSNDQKVAGEGFNQWVDRLMSEKRTVEDHEYVLRKNASLRALLEDRFGKSDAGHGQMNTRPNSGANGTDSSLKNEARQLKRGDTRRSSRKSSELKDIRMPWGW